MTGTASRNPHIDLVRGIAILLVLLLHFSLTYPLGQSPFGAALGPERVRGLVNNGNFGVTMFFVVSGFLITTTSMTRFTALARISLRRFYLFRAARILPCLVLMLAIVLVLGALGLRSFQNHPPVPVWLAALSVLTFWHNLLMERVGYFNYALNITWSLSVEEVFYLVFPLACLTLRREALLCAFWAVFIVAAPLYRAAHQGHEIPVLYDNLACSDAIAFGCIAAVLARRLTLTQAARGAARWIGAAVAAAAYASTGVHGVFGATIIGFGIALILLGAAGASPGRLMRSRPVAWMGWLGRHSYELYLFHIIVLGLMRTLLARGGLADGLKPLWLALFLALSTLLAWLVARFYSDPGNGRLRRRFDGTGALRPAPDHRLVCGA